MKNTVIIVMVVSILALAGFMVMNYSYYRAGGLAAEVQEMRDKQEAAKKRDQERREQAQKDRQAASASRSNASRQSNRQSSGGRYEVNPDRLFGGITLTDQQKSQAATIAAQHRESITAMRRQQRDALEVSRLSMMSDLLKANGGKLPDPAWSDLAPADLNKAVQEHADVSVEAKKTVGDKFASWEEVNKSFTDQMRSAREAATAKLLELLTAEQRAQYDAAPPRTAAAN